MRITVDTDARTMEVEDAAGARSLSLYTDEAFHELSDLWVKVGWEQRHVYTFSWLGRPIIQMPEDMVRFQEAVWALRPDVILETGVAHGGSAVFSASLCRLLGTGRVVAVDIEIRPHNRAAIEAHPLADLITLIEGDSIAPPVVDQVKDAVGDAATVLVVLDSNHHRDHVRGELEAYAPLVTPGSWIVATDGVMRDVADVPRGDPSWAEDNPVAAINGFLEAHPDFEAAPPPWPFNESSLDRGVTHWPSAWLRRTV